jgi:hypothetical protein
MKQYFFIILFFLITLSLQGQEKNSDNVNKSSALHIFYHPQSSALHSFDNDQLNKACTKRKQLGQFRNQVFSGKNHFLSGIQNIASADNDIIKELTDHLEENVNDSAYSYLWDTVENDWKLDSRTYFVLYQNGNVDFLVDKYDPGSNSWSDYQMRSWSYGNSGQEFSETWQYFDPESMDWKEGLFDSYNKKGANVEFFLKIWNDTIHRFTEGFRFVNQFENDTNLIQSVEQEWESVARTWVNKSKNLLSYNNDGIRTEYVEQHYDQNISGNWVNDTLISYSYDDFGDLLAETWKYWNTDNNKWINFFRGTYTYDDIGNLTSELYENWDNDKNEWMKDYRWTYEYNDQLVEDKDLLELWDEKTETWKDSLKVTYEYHESGELATYLEQEWTGDQWENAYREQTEYNNNQEPVMITFGPWDNEKNGWQQFGVIEYTYHVPGEISEEVVKYWNQDNLTWDIQAYDKYDEFGDRVESFEKQWDDELDKYVEGTRILNNYHNSGLPKEVIYQTWSVEDQDWINLEKIKYFWEGLSVNKIHDPFNHVVISPNPSDGHFRVEMRGGNNPLDFHCTVYGLSGIILHDKKKTINGNSFHMNLTGIPPGQYFLRLHKNYHAIVKEIQIIR